jgi:acetylornithine deacetylase/succinyl-diaminopimelate desuccinylase-like protein
MIKMKNTVIWLIILSVNITCYNTFCQTSGNPGTTNAHERLAREIFAELIEINTTVKMGCTKAAEAMAARLKNAGFPEKDISVAGPQPQHMNLVVRYHGKGNLPPILFIGHLDVVEALRQDWSFDPFKFLEKDGYFYGRGTSDMKGDDASLIACLIRLKKEGFMPDRDIIVALTEDEEGGDANGVSWLLKNQRDLIEAEYCINPDGGGGDIKNGKEIIMNIQTCEKIYSDYTIEAHNNGGHSSLPVKDNAIYHIAEALTRLAKYDFPIKLNETTQVFFERNSVNETGQTKADMLAVAGTPADNAAANRLANASPYYNALMRTTCVATIISGGHANNALPQTAKANINCRMLPDDNVENVMATLKTVINDRQITITRTKESTQSPLSPLRKDILAKLDQLTALMWPGVIVAPVMSTGATDGKWLRRAGIPVYGISGMFADVDDIRAHGKDERIGVKEFYKGVEFMYRLMKALSTDS